MTLHRSPRNLGNHTDLYAEVVDMVVRVFIVDDHEIVRRGVGDIIDTEPDLTVVGEAATAGEAIARLPSSGAEVAILDVRLPDGNGVRLCHELRTLIPDLACLMLTSYADDDALLDAILAGAAGFVLKQALGVDLLAAIRTVAAGESLLDAKTTSALLDRLRRERDHRDLTRLLSNQEQVVLRYIGEGLTNRQIASRMHLAEKTVKNYVSHLLTKLGIQSRTQAAIVANQQHDRPGSYKN